MSARLVCEIPKSDGGDSESEKCNKAFILHSRDEFRVQHSFMYHVVLCFGMDISKAKSCDIRNHLSCNHVPVHAYALR